MKSVVKLLEQQGFTTIVYESIIKLDGFTSCKKYFDGFTISVIAYNRGGFTVRKSKAFKTDSGEIKHPAIPPIEDIDYDSLKDLKANVLADIEILSK